MAQLEWANWYSSEGCRNWMDKTFFAGTSFTDIFWQGMRLIFLDEKGKKGLLYNGKVYAAAVKIVAANGKRIGFNAQDQEMYLLQGDFKYNDTSTSPGQLRFEGPDKDDIATKSQYAETQIDGMEVDVHFYNIVEDAVNGAGAFAKNGPLPQNGSGVTQLAYFTAAVVLHQIMHNHGFSHADLQPDWSPGTPYSSTLPQVALQAVLDAAKGELGSTSLPLTASIYRSPGLSLSSKWYPWKNLSPDYRRCGSCDRSKYEHNGFICTGHRKCIK